MLTIDVLKEYGANTEEGLGRCFNNVDFYLRLVGMALDDPNFQNLKTAMEAADANAAFEAAHALKGAIGNVSLTPIYKPVSELTEILRGRGDTANGEALCAEVMAQYEKLKAMR